MTTAVAHEDGMIRSAAILLSANGGGAYQGQQVAARVQVADQLEQQQAPLQQGLPSR